MTDIMFVRTENSNDNRQFALQFTIEVPAESKSTANQLAEKLEKYVEDDELSSFTDMKLKGKHTLSVDVRLNLQHFNVVN